MKILEDVGRIYSRAEIMVRTSPVPKKGGVYFWFFRELPPQLTNDYFETSNGKSLLYVGISPKSPPKNGKAPSKQNLHARIRYHLNGNAEGSTLRLSLGVLLSEVLNIQLRRVGSSGKRMTFAEGEKEINHWLDENAFIGWIENNKPWEIEDRCIKHYSLPLNLDGNNNHPFYLTLKNLRKEAKENAKALPVI